MLKIRRLGRIKLIKLRWVNYMQLLTLLRAAMSDDTPGKAFLKLIKLKATQFLKKDTQSHQNVVERI